VIQHSGVIVADNKELEVDAVSTGHEEQHDRLTELLTDMLSAQPLLTDSDYRLLRVALLDSTSKDAEEGQLASFVAEVYDYTNERALRLSGPLEGLAADTSDLLLVEDLAYQPLPSEAESVLAREVVHADRKLGSLIREREWAAYSPMPPIAFVDLQDGRTERVLTVALRDRKDRTRRLVGVRLRDRAILQKLGDLPHELGHRCEPTRSDDSCPSTGSAGQAWVNVTFRGERIWRFMVVRPAASSGTNGSGVELRFVDFRGRRLLYRAHVPILNIEYFNEGQAAGCGPTYRDWQSSEACFDAPAGTDIASGIRICPTPARTIIESGSDSGNFRGVAIYVDGLEVVVVSEMQAGWYRYISEWRFHVDGTIRPRFGFAAVANPCTCLGHHHHVYWRLDLDVDGAAPNRVEEFNDPPIFPGLNWHTKTYEIRRARDAARHRHWRISNPNTGASYLLVPGGQDGTQTAYGIGDLWVLRYNGSEIDDGQPFTTDPVLSRARLDPFLVPAQPVLDQDVVLWYAAHFVHDETHGHPGGHYVGPDLRPEHWPG
jgi:hypothetical protein